MNRAEWTQIAYAISRAREVVLRSWPPRDGHLVDARVIHDRKLIYFATLDGIDRATLALCLALKSKSSRFDRDRFLRIAGISR